MAVFRKSLILALGLFVLTVASAYAEDFHLHDVLPQPGQRDCSIPVHAEIQQHMRAAVMAGVQKTGEPRIYLGEGCYRLDAPITVQRTDNPNLGYSLDVVGAGPDATVFRASSWMALQFMELSGGIVRSFSIEGPGKTAGRGLLFGSVHADLGSCCFILEDVTVRNFARCFSFGQDYAPWGAAADIVVISTSALNCGHGYAHNGWNTIGLQYIHSSALFSNVGWQTSSAAGQAQQITWNGGGAVENTTDFALWGNGTFTISNFRSEPKALTTPRIVGGSGGGGSWIIEQFTAVDWSGPVSITSNGGTAMTLRQNFLVGQVQITGNQNGIIGTIDSAQNRYYTTAAGPFLVPVGTQIRKFGDCKPDTVFAQCQTYWP